MAVLRAAAAPGRPRAAAEGLQWGLVAALLVVAGVSWALTDERTAGMAHAPTADLGPLAGHVLSWVLMMAAMMLPSVAPMVLAHARVSRRRHPALRGATGAFVGGYLAAWTAYGAAAYAVLTVAAAVLPDVAWEGAGRLVAGGAIVAAAAYQLTPVKHRCLSQCRSPFTFLLDEWRDGRAGALAMGVRHGAWCVGCCWGLMVALFALGMMSLAWMALVTAVVAAEKLLPRSALVVPAVAAALVLLGLAVAFAPGAVPGLPAPGGHAAP